MPGIDQAAAVVKAACSRAGGVFEQAGVNFSHVFGDKLPPSATRTRPDLEGQGFQAMGVSLVLASRESLRTNHARQLPVLYRG